MQDFRIQLIGVNKQVRYFEHCLLLLLLHSADIAVTVRLLHTCINFSCTRLSDAPCHKTREMAWADYITTREHKPAAASAAEARVHSLLQEAQEVSMQTVAATRTTRSTRTRGHAADADPPTAAPGAARASRRAAQPRQPVPKFEEGPSSTCPSSPRMEGGRAAGPAAAEEAAQDTVAVAGSSAEGRQVSGAEARAQARIDAKMAAAFAGAAGRRTVAREAMPGEQMYSKSGEHHCNSTHVLSHGRHGMPGAVHLWFNFVMIFGLKKESHGRGPCMPASAVLDLDTCISCRYHRFEHPAFSTTLVASKCTRACWWLCWSLPTSHISTLNPVKYMLARCTISAADEQSVM